MFLGLKAKPALPQGLRTSRRGWNIGVTRTQKAVLENVHVNVERKSPFLVPYSFVKWKTRDVNGRESTLLPRTPSLCPLSQTHCSLGDICSISPASSEECAVWWANAGLPGEPYIGSPRAASLKVPRGYFRPTSLDTWISSLDNSFWPRQETGRSGWD